MSVPYERLHALAVAHLPTLPIKDTTTWIAILLHTIDAIEDVESDNDFLFIKCHGRITLKTIRMQYWNRYPMDEVKLVYDGAYPKGKDTVRGLRALQKAKYKRLDKKSEHVIVLRAMENEAADAEIDAARDRQIERNIKKSAGGRGGGILLSNTADKAIVIGDSDDEDSGAYSGDESSDTNHSEVNRDQDHPVQEVTEYRGLGGYTSGSAVGSMMKNSETYANGQHDNHNGEGGGHMASAPIEIADDSDDEMGEDVVSETGAHAVYDEEEEMQYSPAVIRTDHTPEDYQLLIDSGELDPATYQLMVEEGRINNTSSSDTEHADDIPEEVRQEWEDATGESLDNDTYQHMLEDVRLIEEYGMPEATHESGRMPHQIVVTPSNPPQAQALHAMPQQPIINPFAPLPLQTQPVELFVLRQQLHPDIATTFNFSSFYNCASPHCRRQMILKPWTRYHIRTFLPLCTECTRVYLGPGMANDPIAMQYLEGQVQGEYVEKERRQLSGNPQNADPDAPFNYAQQLSGPINQPVGDNMNALAYIRNAVGPIGQRMDSPIHAAVADNNKLKVANDMPVANTSTPSYTSAQTSSTISPNTPRHPSPPTAKSGLLNWFKKRLSPNSAVAAQQDENPGHITTSASSSVFAPLPTFSANTTPSTIDYAASAPPAENDFMPISQDVRNSAASVGLGYGTHNNPTTSSTTPSHEFPAHSAQASSYDDDDTDDNDDFDTNIADLIDDDNPSADPSARAVAAGRDEVKNTQSRHEQYMDEYRELAYENEQYGGSEGSETEEDAGEDADDEYDDAITAPVPAGREESDDDYEERRA